VAQPKSEVKNFLRTPKTELSEKKESKIKVEIRKKTTDEIPAKVCFLSFNLKGERYRL
jgi:hypothetical protein